MTNIIICLPSRKGTSFSQNKKNKTNKYYLTLILAEQETNISRRHYRIIPTD